MSEDVWSAQDTSPDAIDAALRKLLRERHAADEALAPARVLNLIVVVDRDWKGEVSNRLERVGRYHASRTILCAVEGGRKQLDAQAVMSYEAPESGGIGVIREHVEIDMGPEHLKRLDTIVDPILVSELPTVLWSPHGHLEAVQILAHMTDVMLLDSDDLGEPQDALAKARDALDKAYVVDLAWLRTTPWRERLAASFDPPDRRRYLDSFQKLQIRHRGGSRASALLLAGWLTARLGWSPQPLNSAGHDGAHGILRRGKVEVHLDLAHADQDTPGLAGVTVRCAEGFSLSLDRGRGGLRASESHGLRTNDEERAWRVLGASRGEGGILGEGVRQALLRDPTYGPALDAALELCPT